MYAVEVSYERDLYGKRSRYKHFEEPEDAAQYYESEAEPPKNELALLIELLATGQGIEHLNEETGKKVVAYELEEAVV